MPLVSSNDHRFVYIIQNKINGTHKLLIVPYLHDRKIFLNKVKDNIDYFYTICENTIAEEKEYIASLSYGTTDLNKITED